MAALRRELEKELAILRVRAADAAAEGREDPATALRLQQVEAALRALEVPAGTLPPTNSGVWSPLPLHESVGVTKAPTPPRQPPKPTPQLKAEPASAKMAGALASLRGEVNVTLDNVLSGSWRHWNRSRQWRLSVLHELAEEHPHGAVNCIANGALRIVSGEAKAAPWIPLWDPVPGGLQTSAEAPDAVTGLTASATRVLSLLASLGTPENPMRVADAIREVQGNAHVEAELGSLAHPSRALPLVARSGDRFHATEVALELLRGECLLPMLLLNGFEGTATHVPPHPITETLDAVLQRLDLPSATFAPNLVPDPRALGVISRESVASYLVTGSGALHWRARVALRSEREVSISDLSWALPPTELVGRIEYVQRVLGRLVGIRSVDATGATSVRVQVEHEHLALGVWWELLSSGIVGRSWPVNFQVRHGDLVRRMTGLELIDAFIDRRLESLAARPERSALQLAWERAHAQEGLCVALRALDDVLGALAQSDPLRALTAFQSPVLPAVARGLPLRSTNDYTRGFTEAQARHLIATPDLASRRLAEEDSLWLRLRADVDKERAHPLSNTPRARLRRQLLDLRARFDVPRQTEIVETFR